MKTNVQRNFHKNLSQARNIPPHLLRHLLFLVMFCTVATVALLLCIRKVPQQLNVKGFVEPSACTNSSPLMDKRFYLNSKMEEMHALLFTGDLLQKGNKLPWQPSRSDVLLVSYMRSGSSFVGQIFNQHPDIFYIYEPLEILTALELDDPAVFRSAVLHLLQVVYSCRFEQHPLYVSKISLGAFRLLSKALSNRSCPTNAQPGKLHLCTNLDPRALNQVCKSHQHTVVKSIRIDDLSVVYNGLAFDIERPWDSLKVLHLVRDPRAIVSSRLSLEKASIRSPWTADHLRQRTRELCVQIWNNLIKGALEKDWESRYHIIRYEDVAAKPLASAKELFDFTDIQEQEEVSEWLRKNINVAYQTDDFSTAKNATVSVNKWRWEAGLDTVYVIQQECGKVMTVLGYRILEDVSQMANLENSLILPMSERQSVFITRSVHRAIRDVKTEQKS